METSISQLKLDLQNELASRKGLQSLYDFLCKKSLEGKLERLEQIEQTLDINKYKLVFIGPVGEGKTTAICHLLNLVGEFEVTDKTKKVKKIQELLATGSGYTTICEVIIRPSEKTFMNIEPYTEEELKELINSFADIIDMKINPQNYAETSTTKGVNIISTEMDRALRNIINLKKRDRIDEAEELGRTFASLDSFKEELFKRASFTERMDTETHFVKGNEIEWIKRTFEDINVAKNSKLSIPKKIFLHVSNNILNPSHFNNFLEIIDTKGLDANKFRKDLDYHINQDNSICLFTTKFPNAPSTDILDQMQRHLSFKSKKFHQRFITFVMPRGQEPENVISSEGTPVNDWQEGINIRRDTIQDTFTQQSLNFFPENIIFYDALRFYYNGKLNLNEGYTLEDVEKDRKEAVSSINSIIQNRIELLKKEIEEIQADFLSIQNGSQQITQEEEELLRSTQNEIKGFSRLNFVNSSEFVDKFVSYYRNQYHHFTKHAINRRFGIYEEKDYDIYNDAYHLAIDLVRKNTEEFKGQITAIIEDLVKKIQHSDLESFIKELLNQFSVFFDNFLKKIGQKIQNDIYNTRFYPREISSNFWFNVVNRRGKGGGYTDDICNMFAEQLDDINDMLKQNTEDLWKSMVIDKTLEFFGSN